MMKRIVLSLFLVGASLVAQEAQAWIAVQKNISELGSHDGSLPNFDFFTLEGYKSDYCPNLNSKGESIFSIRKDSQGTRQMAQLLASQLGNRKINVFFTSLKDPDGNCIAVRVETP